MKYNEWLKNIKGYTNKTIEVYSKYANELIELNLDYKKGIEKYSNHANSTKRLVLSAFKSYLNFVKDDRAVEIELPKRNEVVKGFVTYSEYKEYLLNINKRNKTGFQKYLIIRILFETGIRSSELLGIKKEDLRDTKIVIHGKGNKERYVGVSEWLWSDIEEYINKLEGELLFNFTYKNLYSKIRRIDTSRTLTPHMFRHGYAKHCNNKGISIYDISLSMGHKSIDTTASYVRKNSYDVSIETIF